VLLVDTYDTRAGVERAIEAAHDLAARGGRLVGIRLDSGDLAALASEARAMLDGAGLADVQILASGGLDEDVIDELERQRAPIDAYGVGTKVGVAADAPALDSVYKIVSYAGRPLAKLSAAKATLPGSKQVWRLPGWAGDVVGLRDEPGPAGAQPLLAPMMESGRRVAGDDIGEAEERLAADLEDLPPAIRSLDGGPYEVSASSALRELAANVEQRIRTRERT